MCRARLGLSVALLGLVLLVPWPDYHMRCQHSSSSSIQCSRGRIAAAQGLDLSGLQLEVHVKAAAAAHAVHQDLLHLVGQTDDKHELLGKATGSAAGSFSNVDGMRDLQLAFYTLSASPRVYNTYNTTQTPAGLDLTPRVRDQGSCSTGVAHAVAAAAEAALAAAISSDAAAVEVDAQYLHYCSDGGRVCNSSWSIEEALDYLANQAPEVLRPATCSQVSSESGSSTGVGSSRHNSSISSSRASSIINSSSLDLTNSNSSMNINSIDASQAASTEPSTYMCSAGTSQCSNITRVTPWLKCSYQPLKSFWQIQQHIRNHGAVITPMAVYSDYQQHFNNSSKFSSSYSAYEPNTTAKLLYGQAVVIVGYDNLEQSWTVLNSWGSSSTASRKGGVTADGLVRVKMGAAGVGTPGETYGLECVPAAGSQADPHSTAAYRRQSLRPVSLRAGVPVSNLHPRCYIYTTTVHDTPASIADGFNISLVSLALDNQARLELKPIQFNFPYPQSLEELRGKLSSIVSTTKRVAAMGTKHGYFQPHFKCMLMGDFMHTTCTEQNLTACYDVVGPVRKINRACTLVYPDLALSEHSFKGRRQVKICNISSSAHQPNRFERVAYFRPPEITQPRAVAALLEAIIGLEGARQYPIPAGNRYNNKLYCLPGRYNTSWHNGEAPVRLWPTSTTRYACDDKGYVTHLALNFASGSQQVSLDSPQVFRALMALERLQVLNVYGARGALPPQLGALKSLRRLSIKYTCISGQLPTNYGLNWPEMYSLSITPINQQAANQVSTPATTNSSTNSDSNRSVGAAATRESCQLTGSIPSDWGINLAKSLQQLVLSGNQLSDTLPAQLGLLGNLCVLDLSNNRLSGSLPAMWATAGMFRNCSQQAGKASSTKRPAVLNLSGNQLAGTVPEGWANMGAFRLQISHNPRLHGCLASMEGPNPTVVEFTDTSIEGACPTGADRYRLERQQHDAIMQLLPQLFVAPNGSKFVQGLFRQAPVNLSGWVHDSIRGASTSSTSDPATRARFSVTVTNIGKTAYVTHLSASRVGLNLSVLPALVEQLPMLQSFAVRRCRAPGNQSASESSPTRAPKASGPTTAGSGKAVVAGTSESPNRSVLAKYTNTLPEELAQKAPASLKTLTFISCHIQGSLPKAWGNWSTLEELWLSDNKVTGSLPNSWANMSSLRILYAEHNQFVGLLPPDWGTGSIPERIFMNLNVNPSIFGTIPASWDRFKGLVWLEGTNVKGCIPAGMIDNVITDDTFDRGDIACPSVVLPGPQAVGTFADDPQLGALLGIKGLLGKGALPSWSEDVAPAADGTPAYCSSWEGVSCNKGHDVTALSLAAAAAPTNTVKLSDVHQHLKSLAGLRYLHLANLNLSGTLAEGLAAVLPGLQHLNISGNPDITGSLPKWWAGLSDLEVLDVSGCKLEGSLPESWAALQQLQTLRAAHTELAGQLPVSWALLRNLRVLDISHAKLTGKLPAQWADAAAIETLAAATAAQVIPAATEAVVADRKGSGKGLGQAAASETRQHHNASTEVQGRGVATPAQQRFLLEVTTPEAGSTGSDQSASSIPRLAAAGAVAKGAVAAARAAQAAAAAALTADSQGNGMIDPVVSGLKEMQEAAAAAAGRTAEALQLMVGGSALAQGANRAPSRSAPALAADTTSTSMPAKAAGSARHSAMGAGPTPSADSVAVSVASAATAQRKAAAPAAALTPHSAGTSPSNSTAAPNPPKAAVPATKKAASATPAVNGTRHMKPPSTRTGNLTQVESVTSTLPLSGGLGMLQLEQLNLAGNSLTGTLPDAYAALTQLRLLDLSGNEFSGQLPLQWAALHNLERLYLAGNQLTGTLPLFWARLSSLEALDVSRNELRGPLPPAWVGMRNMTLLNVSDNNLTGEIPKEWLVLAGLGHKLRCLVLSGNGLDHASVTAVKRIFEATPDSQLTLVTQFDAEQQLWPGLRAAKHRYQQPLAAALSSYCGLL